MLKLKTFHLSRYSSRFFVRHFFTNCGDVPAGSENAQRKGTGRKNLENRLTFFLEHARAEFNKKQGTLESGECLEDDQVKLLAGKSERGEPSIFPKSSTGVSHFSHMMADADAGSKTLENFLRLCLEHAQAEFNKKHGTLESGERLEDDQVKLVAGKSERGEPSIFPKASTGVSHFSHMMADADAGSEKFDDWVKRCGMNLDDDVLKDEDTRYRRYLEMMVNLEIQVVFEIRAKMIQYIRNFLSNLEFLEVDTPMMHMNAGGAAARHNELNMKLNMRIAPELHLKMLVIGGLNNVYEIGKQYRFEGIDLTHNLTTCKFYKAYSDYNDLMDLTEKMLSGMVKELTGGYKIKYHANGLSNDPIEIDFTPPYRRIDMIEELEKIANLSIPKDIASEEAYKYLAAACTKFEIKCPPPHTTTRLLDKLVGHFLEQACVNPTFIINHPEIMSPFAKGHRSKPGLSERFELFINKHKLCNAFTEQIDPLVQWERFARFADLLKDRQFDVDEAMAFDESYCTALEYGLPPTGGCLLGIDRLAMLLTDSQNIKEVLFFPAMKPSQKKPQGEATNLDSKNEGASADAMSFQSDHLHDTI